MVSDERLGQPSLRGPHNPRRALEFLLTPEQQELYRHNAWFKHNVDTFIKMMEIVIEGFAVKAEEKNDQMQSDLEAIMRANPYPLPEPPPRG